MTNRKSSFFPSAFILTACALVAVPAMAQQDHGGGAGESAAELPESFSEPMPLFETALGDHHHAISSDNEQAQAWFDQGFRLMYAFGKEDAVRSFREAWKHDPDCAICYWGEAWAWGSYLNGPMRPPEAPHAYAALRKAMALAADGHGTARERDYIDALSVRYVESFDVAKRREQDEAYAEAMKALSERYPDDLDAAALYGDALFLLEPRRGTRDLDDPNVQRLHGVLEGVLARDIEHPGACHLYIHATESTVEPGKAEACAEHLGTAIPGASHINHMPSHTWNEVGRWADGVRANLDAWHSDLKAEVGEGVAIYPTHNLHMLLFAASMDGQGAIAIQAGKDYAKLMDDAVFHVLTLIRFGRFDEVLAVTERPQQEVAGGLWDFAQGYAHLRNGDADFAQVYLDRMLKLAGETNARFRFDSAELLLKTVGGILEGEIRRSEGHLHAAIESFERAVEVEDQLEYSEPEPLPFAARHWLGAALIEAGRFADAERVYRAELEDHPNNGWSLFGLQQALEAQGKASPDVDAEFEKSWARSDTWIKASRF
jgi:tetratricopeptide (TPR) repeat protein